MDALRLDDAGSTAQAATDLAGPPLSRREWALVLFASVYLLGPWRGPWTDLPLFLAATTLFLATTSFARAAAPAEERRRVHRSIALGTLIGLVALLAAANAFGVASARLDYLVLLGLAYVPFAYLQQVVTQGYIVDRIGRRLGGGDELRTALIGGALFAAAHLPLDGLFWPTLAVGVIWALAYLRGASVHALALSHGLLGAAYFLCVLGRDPFGRMLPVLGG